MKIRHPLLVGLIAAFAVSLASVAVSAVAAETPFKGTVNAVETRPVVFPTRFVDREGTGTATYLGKYTEHVMLQINIPTLTSNRGRNIHGGERRHLARHRCRTGDADGSHHALGCRGLHHHRRNGTLRRRNRQLHAEQHPGPGDGR